MCGMTGTGTLVGLTGENAFCYIPVSEPPSREKWASTGTPHQQDLVNPVTKCFYNNPAKQMFYFCS